MVSRPEAGAPITDAWMIFVVGFASGRRGIYLLRSPPVVDAARGIDTGVWLLGSDGGVFALAAPFYGSAVDHSNTPTAPPNGGVLGSGAQVSVSCPAGGSIVVSATIGDQMTKMLRAASDSGRKLCGSGFRPADQQIALRKKNCGTSTQQIWNTSPSLCRPPTARPGTSMHEKGLAIDFANCQTRSTACYPWLSGNAARFGLRNLPSESWHWSTTGS
ncbi:hypothetical protein GCM10009828_017630 [Actinoplanes couchii]|uniref:D-alanyl-D-alanine carboxypeptidase-like core domain-containing protein n=2 Tax=Actinoplanes couchii TaxID=403638 RepID=A0ABQ3XTB2_9ACTN|nr:hypothetical protein Aco03nite_101550 [Actinoplanes couchii]